MEQRPLLLRTCDEKPTTALLRTYYRLKPTSETKKSALRLISDALQKTATTVPSTPFYFTYFNFFFSPRSKKKRKK